MFYKKFISLFVTFGLVLCSFFIGGQALFVKADTLDPQDRCFLEFVREDTDLTNVNYSSIELYDQTLAPVGRQYTFTVGNTPGYALVARVQVGEEFFYEVEELFYNKPAPFTSYQGAPVYITFQTYLDCVDGTFYDLANNRAVVCAQTVSELAYKGFGYMGNSDVTFTDTSETISYATKNTQSYTFPYEAPSLYGSQNGSCCANNAGATIISYYDRFFENLMPDYQSYVLLGGTVIYRNLSVELGTLVETLRDYMAVDGVQQGTTFTGFQQGMQRYVQEKGYTYTTTNLMSWGSLNFESYKQIVQTETPVAIFLNGFTMLNGVTTENSVDTISSSYCAATHVEVGIGYKIETYYNANGGIITTRNYLKVVSGLLSYEIGYLNLTGSGQIVYAIAIDIN